MKAFLERHAVSTYIALTHVLSWAGVFAVLSGRAHVLATPDEFNRLLPFAALTLAAGPTVAGLLMTGILSGVQGFREMLRRLLLWRVGAR